MRRSSADWSSASGLRTTAASRACENARPIAAPTCATSLAGPSRSSRAISEACRLAGTVRAEDGTAAMVCLASPSLSASNAAFVISSTNNGMPSVRSMMSWRILAGSSSLPTTRSITAPASRSPNRFMLRALTCGRPIQGASNSGRKVTISSARRLLIRSTVRPKASRLVGSLQCASSKIISTGVARAGVSNCRPSASIVLCRRCCGSKSSAG
jgi:hypothetical protein